MSLRYPRQQLTTLSKRSPCPCSFQTQQPCKLLKQVLEAPRAAQPARTLATTSSTFRSRLRGHRGQTRTHAGAAHLTKASVPATSSSYRWLTLQEQYTARAEA